MMWIVVSLPSAEDIDIGIFRKSTNSGAFMKSEISKWAKVIRERNSAAPE